jgi:hypothetical protein
MSDHHTDFLRIAADLRRASDEARREAARRPAEREDLVRKAYNLERAAARIEEDAVNRESYQILNRGEEFA